MRPMNNNTRFCSNFLFILFSILFALENCIMDGFCFLSYTYQEQDLQHISTEICNFEFKKKSVCVNIGSNFKKVFSYKDWKEHCEKFFKSFYTSNGVVTEVITVPDITGKIENDSCQNLTIRTLKKWCNYSQDKLGLIVANYDIKDHLFFLGVTESLLRHTLSIKEFPENQERLIAFNSSQRVIFVIRFAIDNLKKAINQCIEDVKLFSLLLKEELKESGVVMVGLITFKHDKYDKYKHHLEGCAHCKYLVVSPEIFDSPEKFEGFWKEYQNEIYFNELETDFAEGNKDDVFCRLSSKILGYMARHKNILLPTLEKDPVKNIEQAEMLLDRYQMEIVYSMENRIILHGDYGTGKTVIALKKIQLLLRTIKDKEVIYYVNFTCKSEVHYFIEHKMKMFKELDQRFFVIHGGYDLSYIVKSVILPREEDKGTEKIHLFVDEYFSENLTRKEADTLSSIFSDTYQFRKSTVLIAAQPIEINRADYFYIGGRENKYIEESHAFDILARTMKVYILKYVMRTTVQINELVQITENFLNNQSNEYSRQREPENKMSFTFKSIPMKMQKIFKKMKMYTQKKSNPNLLSQPSLQPNSQQNSIQVSASDYVEAESQETIDHDELYKLTFSTSHPNKKKNHKIVTTYRYSCSSKIGHGINGPLPKIIQLHATANKYEQIALIGILLKKIENIESKRIAVIHFESNDPQWLITLLQNRTIFPTLNVTNDLKLFLREHNDNLVLVKNYNNVKGLEFSHVLMVLDANEYHLKQYIPETMARSQSNLSILIKSFDIGHCNKDTVADLVKYWDNINTEEKNPILNTWLLQFCSRTKCSKQTDLEYCLDKTKYVSSTTYNVHKNCTLYKLIEEIQDSVNLSMEAADDAKRAASSL